MRRSWAFIFVLATAVDSIWIGEEYWTIVNHDGSLRDGRTFEDFIYFKGPEIKEFVAYWIINRFDGHFEAYGEAFFKGDRVCARFINEADEPHEICGGFRILSYHVRDGSNPFEWYPISQVNHPLAVEYVNHQIARLWSKGRTESKFGGAHLDRSVSYAVGSNERPLHLVRDNDPEFFDTHVELLVIKEGLNSRREYPQAVRAERRGGVVVTPDDLTPFASKKRCRRPLSTAVNELCRDPRYDSNKDGYIDVTELHACQRLQNDCPLVVYDIDADGVLDDDETSKCQDDREADKYVRYCQDLYFDTNRDGRVDNWELDQCLERHAPHRRRHHHRRHVQSHASRRAPMEQP